MAKSPQQRHNKSVFWQEQIEGWQRSGLSQEEYCQKEGLKKCTLQYWRRKLSGKEEVFSLVPVRLTAEKASLALEESSGLRLHSAQGLSVELSVGFDVASLRRLIKVLEEI